MFEQQQNSKSRSRCPVANALELFGDRWSLLIVRDLLLGKNYYREFTASPEGISTNILAERLQRLQRAGIVTKNPSDPRSYHLTQKGEDLRPILKALSDWAEQYIPDVERFPLFERSK